MSDIPTWGRVLSYAVGALASAVLLYAVVYLAVRAALRAAQEEQRTAMRRQEEVLRSIATSAEYVADVADAWAETEAARRAPDSGAAGNAPESPSAEGEDHAAAGQSRE